MSSDQNAQEIAKQKSQGAIKRTEQEKPTPPKNVFTIEENLFKSILLGKDHPDSPRPSTSRGIEHVESQQTRFGKPDSARVGPVKQRLLDPYVDPKLFPITDRLMRRFGLHEKHRKANEEAAAAAAAAAAEQEKEEEEEGWTTDDSTSS